MSLNLNKMFGNGLNFPIGFKLEEVDIEKVKESKILGVINWSRNLTFFMVEV